MKFSSRILHWYSINQRNLPWRSSKEAYKIWISEIILQQTRVAQGLSYYTNFISAFPNIKDLALAKEEDVLKLWQGLGYYSRARNIHFTAKLINSELKGHFPDNYKDLLKLKGVGPYTAAAISSICYNEKRAVVDGNVYRVLARVFNIKTPINSTKGIKEFQELADSLISEKDPGDYNQGLMEIGATVCTPKKTDCSVCPLQTICLALSKGVVSDLPVKEKKLKVRNRYINYYCLEQNHQIIMNKRVEKDIWQNLYDFPYDEYKSEEDLTKEHRSKHLISLVGKNEYAIEKTRFYKHKLSHQLLNIKVQHIKIENGVRLNQNLRSKNEILKLPVPKPIEDFLMEILKTNNI